MSTTARATPATLGVMEPMLPPDGPVIVALDGSPNSDAALPLARALASHANADVMALSIVEPADVPLYGVDGMVFNVGSASEMEGARQSLVDAQALRMLPDDERFPVEVRTGRASEEITRTAREVRARVIVVGRGHHGGIDRILGGDSVMRLLQLGDTPVLAVQPGLAAPPHRVVIATDFSPFSLYAAEVAMTLIAADAHVTLVHVGLSYDEAAPFLQEAAKQYAQYAASSFKALHHLLHEGGRVVDDVLLSGNVGDRMVQFAAEQHADLIVTATHGRGFLRRMVLGSVGATLIHRAPCSVLVVPGSARAIAMSRARAAPNVSTRAFDHHALDAELAAFTTRNRQRLCSVEIDSPELGAQVMAHGLPLVGASFDRHADAVAVMFGTSTSAGTHITHTISGVSGIDLSNQADGRDTVLRISHADGQTLVMLA